ncbi:MAG: hypothetical protein KGK15_03385 [Burkholderiales bacterium]|nr:hypothetical protein [Burkholderiales bacterium]MDE2608440.1 hypothetical protein [Burkholderiales bacterium]
MSGIGLWWMVIALIVSFALGMVVDYLWVSHAGESTSHKRMDWHHLRERMRHGH